MQAIEIPDKAENGIHIFLKRDTQVPQDMSSVPAKLDAIEKKLLQFSSIMQKGMQDVLQKMTNMQDLMVTIANQQQQEQTQTRRESRENVLQEEMHYMNQQKHQVQISNEHLYPVHSQEEVQMLEEEEEEQEEVEDDGEMEVEEYIFDGDEPVDVEDEGGEVAVEVTNSKRRDSFSPRPASKVNKKIKREVIAIQNYKDEERQASDDELIHIVEAVAASENIQSNVDGEEVIVGTTFTYLNTPTINKIKIQHDSKYELIPVKEELDFDFPLTSLDDLKRLNTCLSDDDQMVEAMKHKLAEISTAADFNFQKALQKLLSDNVMHQLNWQGLKGKFRMKDMVLFGLILYQTWFQHIEFDQYEELLKVITKKAHKRYSKTMERRRHRIQGGPNRIVQDLAASMKTGLKTEMQQL